MLVRFACLLLWSQCVRSLVFTPVLEIGQGRLRGLRSVFGVHRYYGIPYASANRFQTAQHPQKWNGTFNAVNPYESCAQINGGIFIGIEDCLRLDVYTPDTAKRGDNIPVMIFIHGGSLQFGYKGAFEPEYLVRKNVIVVSINYRLGVLGFLCINGVANLGLKDQTAAMKWVQRNIAAFGGDPNNVTIGGHSAGGGNVGMHLLSKWSEALFHKAIILSGSALSPWNINIENPIPTFQDAKKFGPVRNEQDVFNIFVKASIFDLLSYTLDNPAETRYYKYTPCVDSYNPDPFLHNTPYNIIKTGDFNKVPLVTGLTDNEGIFFYGSANERTVEDFDRNFTSHLPSIFSWCSIKDKQMIAKKIKSYYIQDKLISKLCIKGLADYLADFYFYSASNAFSKLIAEKINQPVYNYLFSYEGDRNFAKFISGSKLKGAGHVDDLHYLNKYYGFPMLVTNQDRLIIDRYTTLLTNFMKYGDPTPTTSALLPVRWPASNSKALKIDTQLSVVDCCNRGQFLLDVMCQYGLPGYVPCESAAQCHPD